MHGVESSRTVLAAAANQTGMPALVAGVEDQNTSDARINEKIGSLQRDPMSEELQQGSDAINEKLRQGDGSVNDEIRQGGMAGKLQQGNGLSLRDLDERVDRRMRGEKFQVNNVVHEDERRKSEAEKRMSIKSDTSDLERTDTDLSDEEALEDLAFWLGRPLDEEDVIDAEVGVDEGGALQATLALEEELKQAVDAGAIKTLDEIEAEELEEALKEEDSRLKRYWKKFAVFGVIVALAVGLGVGLTRGQANEVSLLELEDVCNYTNTRAPWLRSAVSAFISILCPPQINVISRPERFLPLPTISAFSLSPPSIFAGTR